MFAWYKIKNLFYTRALAYDALRDGSLCAAPLAAPFLTLVQRAHDEDEDMDAAADFTPRK